MCVCLLVCSHDVLMQLSNCYMYHTLKKNYLGLVLVVWMFRNLCVPVNFDLLSHIENG